MDFFGQYYAYLFFRLIVIIGSLLGILIGFLIQSYKATIYIYIGSIFLAGLLCSPNWPIWNKHPLNFKKKN
ncbi:microsomal signal peptidase 12 kda subunit [Anaeramoeba ignava]|uniref:Signal peptidase complex subunit 1 n=1 Tax=Anaeramoeba ignava TaxID=1746090 RepID=A0A9Q0LBJ7_ANAIG|nr:microsomal signal peptidase 12 kda subunit [Anaeramoeba ignava]